MFSGGQLKVDELNYSDLSLLGESFCPIMRLIVYSECRCNFVGPLQIDYLVDEFLETQDGGGGMGGEGQG